MHENSDIVRLVVNSIRKDVDEMNETTNCLALHAIANVGGAEMAEALAPDVHRLLISPCVAHVLLCLTFGSELMRRDVQHLEVVRQEEGRPHAPSSLPQAPGRHPRCRLGPANRLDPRRPEPGAFTLLFLRLPLLVLTGDINAGRRRRRRESRPRTRAGQPRSVRDLLPKGR